ncbi:MAG: class I SAM-dependent methyltransferase [Planctomycetota bacterium]
MTEVDLEYVKQALQAGLINDRVLELGVGYGGLTCRQLMRSAGLAYIGTDLLPGPEVDVVADLEQPDHLSRFRSYKPFGTILLLNVLEHTFDPIRVLDHLLKLLAPGGKIVIIAPAIWPLHDYPYDVWRLLPNFYEEYARRRELVIHPDSFLYVGHGRIVDSRNLDGTYRLPKPGCSACHLLYSRVVHRLFNTSGRGMLSPSHIAVGCILKTPASTSSDPPVSFSIQNS